MINPPTILIAEDEENDRFLIQRALDKAGADLTIRFAHDGEQTIQLLEQTPAGSSTHETQITLLLLDLKMPRVDQDRWLRVTALTLWPVNH